MAWRRVAGALMAPLLVVWASVAANGAEKRTIQELHADIYREGVEVYQASAFSTLSRDYFARFSRDPAAEPADDETVIGPDWSIAVAEEADPVVPLMAGHLREFLAGAMGTEVGVRTLSPDNLDPQPARTILLLESGGGNADTAESFTIAVAPTTVSVRGHDPAGLRDGVVKLVDRLGFREAPFLARGEQVYTPRTKVRLGTTPWMGPTRNLIFLGYNATWVPGGELHALSMSNAIPELVTRQNPKALDALARGVEAAQPYGLKTYARIHTKQKFARDHPVFKAHPEIRGALTWQADGDYILCTEHPLVRKYLTESIQSVFKAAPKLDGVVIIVGGEGFYHCYMRSYGTAKGRTNCARCDALDADTVVANLCNYLAETAREINPNAEIIAWPYSAEHVWSSDRAQSGLIEKLGPGTAIFTEIEKDEFVTKPEGITKHLWDYSIDLIGPGERAKEQVALCRKVGIPIYMKSEPELAFEAPRLPHVPCMDRWADRARALVECGADGAWVFPAFRPCYGTSAAEVSKYFWWNPAPQKDELLEKFSRRLFGEKAGPHVREAWREVSAAITFSPELPAYYTGPYYLGPAHPMCVDPDAELPEVFYGYYFFWAEATDAEGLKKRPSFVTTPTGLVGPFGRMYRQMAEHLGRAVEAIEKATPLVDERHQVMFAAEASPIRWFYHTARTEANFYRSCQIRDWMIKLAEKESLTAQDRLDAKANYAEWLALLKDERENARAGLAVMKADPRLNFKYGGDHSLSDGPAMIEAKLEILEKEITEVLPAMAKRLGIDVE